MVASRQRPYARNWRGASRNRRFAPCCGGWRRRVTSSMRSRVGPTAAAPALRVIESIPALSSPLEATHVPAPPVQGPLVLPPAAEPAVVHPTRQAMPVPADRRSVGWRGFDWRASATVIYLLVAGMLL